MGDHADEEQHLQHDIKQEDPRGEPSEDRDIDLVPTAVNDYADRPKDEVIPDSENLLNGLEEEEKSNADSDLLKNTVPTTPYEIALYEALKLKEAHIERLSGEVQKLKAFISKRTQTYKR